MLPGSRCIFKKRVVNCARIFCLLLTLPLFSAIASAQTDTWTGTTGVWSDPTQWNNGVPATGENIVIPSGAASSTDDFSLAIGTLNLGNAGDTLVIADGVGLTVGGSVANSGNIELNSVGTNTYLLISGSQSFTESGNVTLGSAGPNYIQGASGAGTEVLTNSNTIEGAGSIGNGLMGFVNEGNGTVIANNSAANLFINVSTSGVDNLGVFEALTGGNLTIQGPANSFANYNATTNTLTGGTYTANAGNIYFASSASGITVLSARVTQEAGGQIINTTTGTNAFSNLASIPSGGVLTTQVGFTQPGAFSMAGSLNILPNTVVNVGSVAQIKNNALTGGQWVLDSNLNITGTAAHLTTNSATMTLSGGTFKNTADGSDAFASLTANKKTLRIMNAARFNPTGGIVNTGQFTVAKGCKMTFGSGFGYSQTTGKMTMDGTLTGTVSITGGTYLGAGSVTGNFSLGGGTGNATFSVGDAGKSALTKITGTYTQLTNGILSTPIGGTTVATQYSQVKATGTATLAGTLAAPLLSGFTPTVEQTFTVLSAITVTGTFSNTTIAINSSEYFAISYTPTSVVLTVTAGTPAE